MEFFLRKVYPWLIEFASVSPIFPFIIALLLITKHKSLQFRLLFALILVNVIAEIVGQVTVYLGTTSNLWLGHIITPAELCILAAVYYHSFKRPAFKKIIFWASIVFVIFSISDSFFGDGVVQMNSVPKMIANTILIGMTILYFYKVANDLTITYLDRDPIFLLSCGLLIYKAGTSMSYAMFNAALAESYDAARLCITFILVLNVFFNVALIFVLKRTSLR
ncbi:hypothetical protein ACSX1A_01515 [Pontibacter sp. MBLB2868]|uniref:hypothetical protein n=1 Tax=Pontibacter sp. MBLB2868 TaxID=3451555 RepID=UPI003F74B7DA